MISRKKGFSTIEVIASIVLLSLASGAIITSLIVASNTTSSTVEREKAATLAAQTIERAMAIPDFSQKTSSELEEILVAKYTDVVPATYEDTDLVFSITPLIPNSNSSGKLVRVTAFYLGSKSVYYEVYIANG